MWYRPGLPSGPCPPTWPCGTPVHAQSLSCAQLLATLRTVACQTPLSMEFSRQEPWSRLPFHPPGDLPDAGIEPVSLASPVLAGSFFITDPPGKPCGTPAPHPQFMLHVSSSYSEACFHGDTRSCRPAWHLCWLVGQPGQPAELRAAGEQVGSATGFCLLPGLPYKLRP